MTGLGAPFRRMYISSATSNLADGIGRTALPLLAVSYTRSPVLVAGLSSFVFLPWLLFALVSGTLVDRVDRRYAMAGANVVRALASAALVLLIVFHAGTIATLYAVAFALGTAETVYDSAVRALLPQVVERRDLDRANSLLTVEETLGQTFLGSPLGSALFVAAMALPFGLNAAGFALAALLVLTLRGSYRPVRKQRTSVRQDIADGARWLARHRLLRGLTLISACTAGASSMATGVLVLYVLEVLHLPSGDFGWVVLVAGAGALVGGVTTPRLTRRFGRTRMLTGGSVLAGAALTGMGFVGNGWVAAVLFGVEGATVMFWNIITMSVRQALIPHELFGRVQGAYRTLVWGAIPLGSLLGGAVAHVWSIPVTFVLSGLLMIGLAGALGVLCTRHRAELTDEALAGVDTPVPTGA